MHYTSQTWPGLIKERKVKYEGKGKDPITERILRLLKDKKDEDRELALKILKKLFHR